MIDERAVVRPLDSVLIIDDSDGDALLAEMVVNEFAPDASVRHIDRGSTALALLRTETFSLILLDLAMPGLTGFDVLDTLETEPGFSTEIVVLTSSTRVDDRERVESRGIVYVVKDSDFATFRLNLGHILVARR